ncbi:MBL fold metallo-hydrolase [Rhodococcus sp. X156]|uniref:MBL fold metallo-hydrolase n=1 Tax=Rhodococcus sp. X156 TaxID=2499145 RepID=UPI000FD85B09|nr:MBL fold metallo-hydrolase [Rhodococcus sp. X156]
MSDWTTPGVYPVAEGVHRIPLPLPNDGLRAVNVYAITDGDSLVLVDSGWAIPESMEQLERGLATLGADLGDVSRILVTHVHRDHYTQAVTIRRRVGSDVALGAGEKPSMDLLLHRAAEANVLNADRMARYGAQQLADLIRNAPPSEGGPWEAPDQWLEEGDTIALGSRSLDSVPTPGHTRGHVVFVDAAADLLFAGDHVLPSITPSIAVEPGPPRLALGDYLQSLRVVRAMPDRMLLPAHGAVTDSAHKRIDELLEHHDTRLADTLAAVTQGSTVLDVARILRWTRHKRSYADLDIFNQVLAIGETAAHLDLLVHQGRLRCDDRSGVSAYGS